MKYRYFTISFFALLLLLAPFWQSTAAPRAVLWSYWNSGDEASSETVDHSFRSDFLDAYLVTGETDGVNSREQMVYWINLYNALTVKLILDHFPVESIRDIDISPGILSDGPWFQASTTATSMQSENIQCVHQSVPNLGS